MRRFPSPKGPWRHRRRTVLADIARREWLLRMLALGAAGCSRRNDRAAARASTVTMAVSDAAVLDPDQWDTSCLTFLPLLIGNAQGDLEGRLAERWEHSADYREWTYHVRPGLRWHDGVPVTAHDVKFTLDLFQAIDEETFPSNTVLNDLTVRVARGRGREQSAPVWPKHRLEHLDPKRFWEWEFWHHPIGNGPYRFVRYLPGQAIEFEANTEYYRGKPQIERLILKFVGDAGLTELLSGNADVVMAGNPLQIPRVVADDRFRVYYSISRGALAIYWKHDHPLFRDPRIRHALTLAIDRKELLGVLNLPADLPFSDGVFTERQVRRRELPEPLPYDPARATALLEEAGWHDRDGDGVREQDGRPFGFTVIARPRNGEDRLAVLVQAHLRRVGVQMEIQLVDRVQPRVGAGQFEAAVMASSDNTDGQRNRLGRTNRQTGYANRDAWSLIDAAVVTVDPDELDRLYRELTAVYRVDLPITRLVPNVRVHFAHRRLRGMGTPFHADPDRCMEDLWIDDRNTLP